MVIDQDYRNEALTAYIKCALWSSTGDDDEPLDSLYTADDLAEETISKMRADVDAFVGETAKLLGRAGVDPEQCGHDLWLTRNHHGAGFWDRGLGLAGDELTTSAHAYGEVSLYVSDDGRIYSN